MTVNSCLVWLPDRDLLVSGSGSPTKGGVSPQAGGLQCCVSYLVVRVSFDVEL